MHAPDPSRFILMGSSHGGNVGAAARAMEVMGFSDLVLVAPRFADVLSREDTVAMASGAADILARARIVSSLAEALDGISHACATAMTPRDFGPPTSDPRRWFGELAQTRHRVAFVFGSERYGLSNDDVYRCQHCISIPTAPGYGSLNLAQAVQVVAYEWRLALGGYPVVARTVDPKLASGKQVQALLDHWRRTLVAIGYLDPAAPKKLMARLRRIFDRAELTVEEINVIRGIAHATDAMITPKSPPNRVGCPLTPPQCGDDGHKALQ